LRNSANRIARFKAEINVSLDVTIFPLSACAKLVPNTTVKWIQVRAIGRPMIFVKKARKIVGAPFLYFFVNMWLYAVLLEGPMAPKYVIAILESD